jgi:hypothetical protein
VPTPTKTPVPPTATNTPAPPTPTPTPPQLGAVIADLADLQSLANEEGCPGACNALGVKVMDAHSHVQGAILELSGSPDIPAAIGHLQSARSELQSALGLDPAKDAEIQGYISSILAVLGSI